MAAREAAQSRSIEGGLEESGRAVRRRVASDDAVRRVEVAAETDVPGSRTDALVPIVVAVGSGNPVKLNAVKAAFGQAFPDRVLEVYGVPASSGVSSQPLGDAETRHGAVNRATDAARLFTEQRGQVADFTVGLEGGVAEGDPALAALGVATDIMECFAWMAVRSASHAWGLARSATLQLPPAAPISVLCFLPRLRPCELASSARRNAACHGVRCATVCGVRESVPRGDFVRSACGGVACATARVCAAASVCARLRAYVSVTVCACV